MRAVVQRVDKAEVRSGGRALAKVEKGTVVFLGVERGDREADAEYLAEKISHLRIFEDELGKMDLSLSDIGGDMLVVSQFTLLGNCRKGRRPSFTTAETPRRAKELYRYFIGLAKENVRNVAEGEFQAEMSVQLTNDGPVTLILDSRRDLCEA